ncbi:MAG: VWA domain-containing protein [Bacteroidales bacterium]|nr:VWA domain-containing protein [Bacteroidales bacterium]
MFTDYSLWWLIPILVFAFAISWFVYLYKQESFSKQQSIILFSLRGLAISLLLFLLLNPIVKTSKNKIEKPIIVIAQDNSSSIIKTKDSLFYSNEYLKSLNSLSKSLNKNFEVKLYSFGSETKENSSFDFKDYQTDFSDLLNTIQDEYFNQNLSAIIIASDGINNYGKNPLNMLDKNPCPIYTIALGDTNIQKDVSISSIRYNDISYTEDICPLEISIKAKKAKNEKVRVDLIHKGKNIFSKEITINQEDFSLDFATTFTSFEAGVQSFTINVTKLKDEINIENNKREFFVKILDSRKNIVFISAGPHPDISSLKQSVNKNKNYNLINISNLKELQQQNNINLLIAHQLPYDTETYEILKKHQENSTPILYIIGKRTNLNLFNQLNNGVKINAYNKTSQTPCLPQYNNNFSLFSLSKESIDILSQLPPLSSPLARYDLSAGIQTLFYQNHNSLKTEYPLICFNNNAENKSATIFGEDIWKWRLRNYLHNKSTQEFDEIIQKTIQYLVSDKDKSTFKIRHENIYNQNQKIRLEAEVYNQSYQLVNNSEVKINLKNENGDKYDYTFSKTSNAYALEISELDPGKYNFTATTNFGGLDYKTEGSFIVSANELESIDLVAKHDLLYTLSVKTNGKLLYPSQMQDLEKILENQEDAKPIIHKIESSHKLINTFWYWIIIILCFSTEWFLRKYWGKI